MRVLLAAAVLSAAVLSAAGAGMAAHRLGGATAFRDPPSVSSHDKLLDVTLTAVRAPISIGDQRAVAEVYNGSYTPPTLRAHPGDLIRLQLINRLDQPTNLHTHGLHVSPGGTADNIFLTVPPGATQQFEYQIPAGHPAGLYWYHPHEHHFSNEQVNNGMAGALIIEGLLDSLPTLRGVKERVLLLKDIQLEDGHVANRSIGVGTVRTVNGQVNPSMTLRPGDTELWRIGNVGANLYYRLRLDGHRFYEIARDGKRLPRVVPADELFVPPGGRVEVLVQGGGLGAHSLRTMAINTGPGGNQYAGTVLATLQVEGAPVVPRTIPTKLLPVPDLRGKVSGHRTVVFSETDDGKTLFIDGKTFDPNRVDTRVRLGAVEEWTIRNESDELHDFHIHQGGFQLVEVNGVPQEPDGYFDTVNVPLRGEIKVVIPFTDPVIVGKFVYHCHLLSHEDRGMMATIEVTR